jgi:hypothetical protein
MPGQAAFRHTVEEHLDAVVPVEQTRPGDETVEILAALAAAGLDRAADPAHTWSRRSPRQNSSSLFPREAAVYARMTRWRSCG